MKTLILTLIVLLLVAAAGVGVYLITQNSQDVVHIPQNGEPTPTPPPPAQEEDEPEASIGTSVQGRDIMAYRYGSGDTELLFVGGFHGGYSWNTALVAYELMDYLQANPNRIPGNVRVTVIPALNPDGLHRVVGREGRFTAANVSADSATRVAGRFNANSVDLNRNFDCEWQPTATWQTRTVSPGSSAFSEPESKALRDYAQNNSPAAVVIWYAAANGVFASACDGSILPETRAIMNAYANASGYPAYDKFEFYDITGDAANWLSKNNIPAFSVLLSTHEGTEWDKNRAGIEALLQYYAN